MSESDAAQRLPGDPETTRIEVAHGSRLAPHDDRPSLAQHQAALVAELQPGTALLLILEGPDAGARYLLDEDEVTVGRRPGCGIVLDDVSVSRRHAAFRRTAEGFRLVDTGSTNGTYVNRRHELEVDLHPGDEVQIGKYHLVFHPARATATGA